MSKLIESQAEFQQLALERLDEAAELLAVGKWGGAYYLAGYAVELALKSCIIKRLMASDAFPQKDFSRDCYTHQLKKLVELADMKIAFDAARLADPVLQSNWTVLLEWSEEARYHLVEEPKARILFNAISDPGHGVLAWIRTQW